MKSRYLIFILVLITIFAACNGEERPTPTPFAEEDVTEEALNPATPLTMSITDLAADPEAFANSFVEITGQYQRLPLLVCDTDPHPSPATWQLIAEDGSLIALGGFDSQLRSLLPDNLTMTVAGVWQLFEGPVGCGKDAANTQIWYLKVSDIISPSPVTSVTLTPTGEGSQIADSGEEEGETAVTPSNDPDSTNTPTQPGSGDTGDEPAGTPTSASTTVPAPPGSTPTNSPTPGGSGSGGSGGGTTATNTPNSPGNPTNTPTSASGGGSSPTTTPTSSATPSSGGGGGNPTPTSVILSTATRNPNDFDAIEFDDLSPEEPILEFLDNEEAHLWPIFLENTGAITITAIAEPSVNLVLEIIDPADDVVQQADNGGDGALESIVNAQLNLALDYKIRVYDLNGAGGEYCLIFSEEEGFPDTIKGRLDYDQTVNQTIEPFAINYWCFLGNEGDDISITATATGDYGAFLVSLSGPPDFGFIGSVYTDSMLTNILLEEDGMYIIGVLEFGAGEADYSLTITEN